MKLPSNKINLMLTISSPIVLVGIALMITQSGWGYPLFTLGAYLLLFSIGLIFLIVCLQCKIDNVLLRSLLQAYLMALCYVSGFALFTSIISIIDSIIYYGHYDISDIQLIFSVSLFAFGVLCPDSLTGVFLLLYWAIFIILLCLSLWGTTKIGNKKIRLSSLALIIILFGAAFYICYCLSLDEVAQAIAANAMSHVH